jgi:hypothetical protein
MLAAAGAATAAAAAAAAARREQQQQQLDAQQQQQQQPSREEVIQWHNTLYESTNVLGAPGGGSSALRGWAMVAIAMFEASNAVEQRYTPYLQQQPTHQHQRRLCADLLALSPHRRLQAQRVATARVRTATVKQVVRARPCEAGGAP